MVCLRHGIPMVQLRCVSNRTGNRENAGFDLEGTIEHLHRAVLVLVEKGWR